MTDRETAIAIAIGILTRVSAELVRIDDVPDPDAEPRWMIGNRELRLIRANIRIRGREIVEAIKLLKKENA